MKTSYDIEDSPDLASVVNSHPDSSSSSMETENTNNQGGDLGYDIMDDIQKSQSNYITEYIVIPLCIIGVIALVVFMYLKFVKKSEPPQADADVEKQALQDNENGDNNDDAEEDKKPESAEKTNEDEQAVATTENVGQEEAEKKTEEEAKE